MVSLPMIESFSCYYSTGEANQLYHIMGYIYHYAIYIIPDYDIYNILVLYDYTIFSWGHAHIQLHQLFTMLVLTHFHGACWDAQSAIANGARIQTKCGSCAFK